MTDLERFNKAILDLKLACGLMRVGVKRIDLSGEGVLELMAQIAVEAQDESPDPHSVEYFGVEVGQSYPEWPLFCVSPDGTITRVAE